MMTRNIHPVDELAEVRATMKTLAERETALKAEISAGMANGDALFGHEHVAFQKLSSRKGAIDTAALAKAGVDADDYRKPDVAVLSIVVEKCAAEAVAA